MNRTRCPWCGKRIDKTKDKDKSFWQYAIPGYSMLKRADCAHCGHKYGQFPIYPYLLICDLLVLVIVVLLFIFQSYFLLFVSFLALLSDLFMHLLMPYSKLDDKGKPCEDDSDLHCKMVIIEKYGEIKCHDLYFLDNCFDDFEPFILASPIYIYYVPPKSSTVLGEFLYMNKKNYDYIGQENCDLYDTQMNLIAKIKFETDIDITSDKI